MTTKANNKKTSTKTSTPSKADRAKVIADRAKKPDPAPVGTTPAELKRTQGRDNANPQPAVSTPPAPAPVAEVTSSDQAALAAAVASGPTASKPKELVRASTVKGPTKLVWEIADRMKFLNPLARRVDVVNACIAAGIATHTARTQYQRWYTAQRGATK